MTTKDFAIAVNKFFFYSMNYTTFEIEYPTLFNGNKKKFLPGFFRAFEPYELEHLIGKWETANKRSGSYGAINDFYGELDGEHRAKMLKYICELYQLSDEFGINLEEI